MEGVIIVCAVAVVFIAVTIPFNSLLSLLVLILSLYTKRTFGVFCVACLFS